jgi:tetratricopeptide (TPR) repeat protein
MMEEFSFSPHVGAISTGKSSESSNSLDDKAPGIASGQDPELQKLSAKLQQNPNDANAFYNRGLLYAKNGDISLAVKDFDQAIRLNPNDPEAFNNRCWVRAVSGELELALRDCNEALRLRPNFADALDSRGLVYLKLNLNSKAIADFDSALRLKPNQASSLYGRGVGKLRVGKAEGNDDIAAAKAIKPGVAEEFAGYGIAGVGK